MTSHDEHNSIAPSIPTLRSKIGNRSALHMTGADGQAVDGRTEFARAFRDVLGDIVSDLGGFDALSEAQWQLCRRAAALSLECMRMESKQVSGQGLDIEAYGGATDRLRRLFVTLGLRRKAKDITPPDLQTYIAGKAQEGAA